MPLHIPSNISLNVSPAYTNKSKLKGQSLLGQKQLQYTHFVPTGGGSEHIKQLLGIQETDTSETKPIEGYKELLKAEKVMKGEEVSSTISPSFDSKFEQESKEFMETPQIKKEDTFEADDQEKSTPEITARNDADIAPLIAANQPKKTPKRTPKKRKKYVRTAPHRE